MSVEAGGGGEPFVADVAYVRLLPRVGPRVALQKARTVEALAADLSERMRGASYFYLRQSHVPILDCQKGSYRDRLKDDY